MIIAALKIIGIILLTILCIIILLLCLCLFVPVRYRFKGIYDTNLNADVCVTWPVTLLKVLIFVKNNQVEYVIKLFGGVVLTNTDVKQSWLGRKLFPENFEEESHETTNHKEKNQKTSDKELSKLSESLENFAKEEYENVESEVKINSNDNIKQNIEEQPVIERKTEKRTRNSHSLFDSIQKFISKMKRKCKTFIENLKKINQKREALLKVYHSKRFEIMKKDIMLYIKELFSIVKPDHLEGELCFGFEDPALTGEVLGIIATVLPLYDGFLSIYPNFENSCLKGNIKGKGKIFLFLFIKLAIKVILNKNLIKVTKKVQTILEA